MKPSSVSISPEEISSPSGDLACDINRAPTKGWSFLHLCFWFPQCVPSSSFTYEYAFVQCSCESRFTVRTFDWVAVVQSKIKIALYRARQVRMYKGPFIRTSAKFLGFWTPSPLVRILARSIRVNPRNLPYYPSEKLALTFSEMLWSGIK